MAARRERYTRRQEAGVGARFPLPGLLTGSRCEALPRACEKSGLNGDGKVSPDHRISRRGFLRMGSAGLLLPLAGRALEAGEEPVIERAAGGSDRAKSTAVRMGLLADLHHGLEPTAMDRLEAFVEAVSERKPDCLLQLGDFNYGDEGSRECMKLWEQFRGPRYHVLGNHDMDRRTKEEILDFWSMEARHYSFDLGGYHFIVLDRNNLKTSDGFVPYGRGNYFGRPAERGHADAAQLEWLAADLATTTRPTVVFVHQGLGMQDGPYPDADPRKSIEAVLQGAERRPGVKTVVACFCGHHHIDRYNEKNGIHYVWMNSASYYWVGEKYGRMAPYRDALFAFVTFRPDGWIEIQGRTSDWVPPTPADRGYPEAERLTTKISDRRLRCEA